MKDNIVARVVVLFLIMVAILVSVATVAIGNVGKFVATSDWVNHTHALISEGDGILTSLHAGDAALRTFLITNDPRDQAAYREAYTEMVEHLSIAKALVRSEPKPKKRIDELEPLIQKHVDLARELVRSRQQGNEEPKKLLLADGGGESMRRIRKVIATFQGEQKELLKERDKRSYAEAQTTRWTVISGLVVNFVLLVFAAFLLKDDIASRKRAANALSEANAMLEAKVKERTIELAASNESLRAENLERTWGNKSLEHQLRYSNLIINSINDLVFVLTKTLNITRVNPAVAHLTGRDPKDLITTSLASVVKLAHDADGGRPDVLQQALKEGREIQDLSVVVLSKDGRPIPHRLNLVPLRDRDKVVGGVVTLRASALAALQS
jgi:PAS domain S-box-containing protein